MNQIKKIGLLLAILMFEQTGYAASFTSEKKYITNEFVAKSFVLPWQQVAICTLFGKPFAKNTKTGKPVLLNDQYETLDDQNKEKPWPTIDDILVKVNDRTDQKEALQATKLAIDIAIELASVTIACHPEDQNFFIKHAIEQIQDLIQELKQKKYEVEDKLQEQITSQELVEFNKYAEYTEPIEKDKFIYNSTVQDGTNYIKIYTKSMVQEMLNKEDFKVSVKQSHIHIAAETLFEQCYLAQINNEINTFKSMETLMKDFIKQNNSDKAKIHEELVKIAQAVKTALYIAETTYGTFAYNSYLNRVTEYIPYATNGLVPHLRGMYEKVRKNLMKKEYGATDAQAYDEVFYDTIMSTAKNLALAGVAVGAVVGTAYAINNRDVVYTQIEDAWDSGSNIGSSFYNTVTGGVSDGAKVIYNAGATVAKTGYNAGSAVAQAVLPAPTASIDYFTNRANARQDAKDAAKKVYDAAAAKLQEAQSSNANEQTKAQLQANVNAAQEALEKSKNAYQIAYNDQLNAEKKMSVKDEKSLEQRLKSTSLTAAERTDLTARKQREQIIQQELAALKFPA